MITKKTLTLCFLAASSLMILSCRKEVKDRDGNLYNTVKINNQEWMTENLKVSHFRNGDTIYEARSSEEWQRLGVEGKPAWCNEQNDPEKGKKYGKLYNWFALNDSRGLVPKGWHVPSDVEWTILTDFLGGGVMAALKMRTNGFTENDEELTESSFIGLPGGNRSNNGTFYGIGSYGYWWSATEVDASNAWIRVLNYISCNISSTSYNKSYGISVRCLRD